MRPLRPLRRSPSNDGPTSEGTSSVQRSQRSLSRIQRPVENRNYPLTTEYNHPLTPTGVTSDTNPLVNASRHLRPMAAPACFVIRVKALLHVPHHGI